MRLGLGLRFGERARGGPSPYTDVQTAGVASQAVTVDNGMYDVLVEGATKQWKRIFVVSGSYTVTPANADATWTRARFFGPYSLSPDTGDAVGSALAYGAVFNSRGSCQYGYRYAQGKRLTAVSTGANIWQNHQGWTTDGTYYYTADTAGLQKRAKDASWTLVAQNASPFTGLSGNPNHLGDLSYYNGRIYVPAEKFNAGAGLQADQQIAVYSASDLSLIETHPLSIGSAEASGVAVDADNGVIYVSDFYDATTIRRYSLTTFAALSSITIPGAWGNCQGVAYRNGRLYLSCARNINLTPALTVVVVDLSGAVVDEYLLSGWSTGTQEGIDFDGSNLGVTRDDSSTSTSEVRFFSLPSADANFTKSGLLLAKDRFLRVVSFGLPSDYTVFAQVTPTTLFDFNAIWDNTGAADNHEGWVYANGRVAGRALSSSNTIWTGPVSAGAVLTYGFSYNASTLAKALYVNNADRTTGSDASSTPFPANSNVGIGGAHPNNSLADGLFAYFYAFSRTLTLAEKQALEANPGRIWTPTNALTQAQKDALAA